MRASREKPHPFVLQIATETLLRGTTHYSCTAKNYSSTPLYYKVLLSTTNKKRLHLPRKVTLELDQVLHLPGKVRSTWLYLLDSLLFDLTIS